jgi:hypothetical protein
MAAKRAQTMNLSEQHRIKLLSEKIEHLNTTLKGALNRIAVLEGGARVQSDTNAKLAKCMDIIADELDMLTGDYEATD